MRTDSCQSASLTRGSPTVFRCYIRMACSLQTNRYRVHLEAAWGKHSHTRFDWHVLTYLNEPEWKKCYSLVPSLQTKVVWKGLLYIFKCFPYLSHHYSLSFSFLSACLSLHPSSYFSIFLVVFCLSFVWISAHCATRKCTSWACQLHHCAFYLERPKPTIYQWNQPGI